MEIQTNGNEMNADLTEIRNQLRSRSAYTKTRRFVLLVFIVAAIGGIFAAVMVVFNSRPTEDHSVANILLFLWVGIPLIIQGARYLNGMVQTCFDLADAALSREARAQGTSQDYSV